MKEYIQSLVCFLRLNMNEKKLFEKQALFTTEQQAPVFGH